MRKVVRILEIPIYLLVIALCVYEIEQAIGVSIFLIIVSVLRLIVNHATDQYVYKR